MNPRHRSPWTSVLVPRRYREAVVGDAFEEAERRGTLRGAGTRLWLHGFIVRAAAAAWWQRLVATMGQVGRGGRARGATGPARTLPVGIGHALGSVSSDTRYAIRQLRRSPGFAAVAMLSLALGIGANIAIFSVMDAMLLRPLPVADPEGLVEFVHATPDGGRMTNLRYPVFVELSGERGVVSELFAFTSRSVVMRSGNGDARRFTAHAVSGSFFRALGAGAALGRPIGPGDDRPGAEPVAVLSHAFWSREFGQDRSVIGTTLRLDGESVLIIGVMPPGFFGVDRSRDPDVWIPLSSNPEPYYVWVLGRLKPGATAAQARADLEPAFLRALESSGTEDPESQMLEVNRAVAGTSGLRWSFWDYSSTLRIVLGLTGLVLLITCVNLATLLTARAAARTREIGIRLAIGAGRWRTVRFWITENLLLAIIGGVVGLVVAAWGHRLLLQFLMSDSPARQLDFRLDARLLGMAFAVSLAVGLLFGLVPSVNAARGDPLSSIRGATRSGSARRLPLARAMLSVQAALSLVLLVGAGLFVRNLRNLVVADPGFERANLVLMTVDLSTSLSQRNPEAFWTRVMDRVTSRPDVRSAGRAGQSVLGSGMNKTVWVSGAPKTTVRFNVVGPRFFETVGIPVRLGRVFEGPERIADANVAVVNEAFVRRFFHGENPLGARVSDRGPDLAGGYEIVGVVGDSRAGGPRQAPRPILFQPIHHAQPERPLVLHVRTTGESAAVLAAIRREILSVDADVVVDRASSLNDVITGQLGQDRMFATLAATFGILALLLVSIGLYGLMAWSVALRTQEIGTRMAFGARPADVARPILRDALLVAGRGMVIGIPAAYLAARLLQSTLFGIEPHDPLSMSGAAALVLVVTVTAAWIPSRRAARTDPLEALSVENRGGG